MSKEKSDPCDIPEREQWLYQNHEAMALVQKGLEDLKAGRFVADPTADEEDGWLDEID